MGNTANICFIDATREGLSCSIYAHWQGGPESAYGFLDELVRRGNGVLRDDVEYTAGRFVQVVGEYLDKDGVGATSLGIQPPNAASYAALKGLDPAELFERLSGSDHGLYVITPTWGRDRRPYEVERLRKGVWLSKGAVARERAGANRDRYLSRPALETFFADMPGPAADDPPRETIPEFFLRARPVISPY